MLLKILIKGNTKHINKNIKIKGKEKQSFYLCCTKKIKNSIYAV